MAIEDLLAAIYTTRAEKPSGAGLLVGGDLVLTCAHVVNNALGRALLSTGRPTGQVRVKLHASPSVTYLASIDSGDDAWSDPPADRQAGADLCLLRLDARHSDIITAVRLVDITNKKLPIEFRAAGYPPDWEIDIAIGIIVGRDQHGLYMLRPESTVFAQISQLKGSLLGIQRRPPGVIHGGFSGGPVEVGENIAGLITEARDWVSEATAYMIPVSAFPQRIAEGLRADADAARQSLADRGIERGPTSLELHIRSGNAEIVTLIFQAGLPPDTLLGDKTPLDLALDQIANDAVATNTDPARLQVVRSVVAAGPRGLASAAHTALTDMAPARLTALLRAGVPIDSRDESGQSLAARAMRLDDSGPRGDSQWTKLLVTEGSPAPAQLMTWMLLWAASRQRLSVVSGLLDRQLPVDSNLCGGIPSEDIREDKGDYYYESRRNALHEREYWWPGGTALHRLLDRSRLHPLLRAEPDEKLLQLLLDHGASPNAVDALGRTPLHIAADQGFVKVTRLLLDRGADPRLHDPDGRSALHLAIPSSETALVLLERWLPDDGAERAQLLGAAVYRRDPILVRRLLELGCDPNLPDDNIPTALFRLAYWWKSDFFLREQYSIPCLELLLAHNVDPTIRAGDGRTALHEIVREAEEVDVSVINLLLDKGADPDARDKHGQTPLMSCNNEALAKRLLLAGASSTHRDDFGFDAVDHAFLRGADDVFKLLTAEHREARPEAQLIKAIQRRDEPEVRRLLDSGVPAQTRDRLGDPALHLAATHHSASIITLLLDRGADIDAPDNSGHTPLANCLLSLESGLDDYESSVMLLLDRGATTIQVNKFKDAAIFCGGRLWYSPSVSDRLLQSCSTVRSHRGETALMAAIDWGTLAHVQYLLRSIDVNAADINGRTALHAAAGGFHQNKQKYIEEYIEKTRLLLASGAQLEAVDHAGETPLFAAVSASNREMVELLLAAHADFTRRNAAGETLPGVALRVRDPALLKRLRTLTTSR